MTTLIPGLSALADRYDVRLSDFWGVIHNGRDSFPEPCASLALPAQALQLPAPLTRLSCLADLVLSDNNLTAARLTVSY